MIGVILFFNTKVYSIKKEDIIPLKPPVYNGQINKDMEAFSRNINIFYENNPYNNKILIIDINFFIKNEHQDENNAIDSILGPNYNSSIWNRYFASHTRKQYISKSLDIVLKKLNNIANPTISQLIVRHLIPDVLTRAELINILYKMCVFTFSVVDIKTEPKYTTKLNIHSIPVFKVFIRSNIFNNDMSSSICDIKGILTNSNKEKIFATFMEKILQYILEVHIASYVKNNQFKLFIQDVNNAYNKKYNCKNVNNDFSNDHNIKFK